MPLFEQTKLEGHTLPRMSTGSLELSKTGLTLSPVSMPPTGPRLSKMASNFIFSSGWKKKTQVKSIRLEDEDSNLMFSWCSYCKKKSNKKPKGLVEEWHSNMLPQSSTSCRGCEKSAVKINHYNSFTVNYVSHTGHIGHLPLNFYEHLWLMVNKHTDSGWR